MIFRRIGNSLLPLVGIGLAVAAWWAASLYVTDLPSPARTWEESKLYLLEPWAKRGEMDQGMARLAYYSLIRVAQGFFLGILIGTPLGFLLGASTTAHRMFDPVIQVLRPISPLAWLPLGLVLFQKSEPAALFAIAVCSMWPTVLNTMAGVRAIPQDYWNVAKVLLHRGQSRHRALRGLPVGRGCDRRGVPEVLRQGARGRHLVLRPGHPVLISDVSGAPPRRAGHRRA